MDFTTGYEVINLKKLPSLLPWFVSFFLGLPRLRPVVDSFFAVFLADFSSVLISLLVFLSAKNQKRSIIITKLLQQLRQYVKDELFNMTRAWDKENI